jgi:hypothetical protein
VIIHDRTVSIDKVFLVIDAWPWPKLTVIFRNAELLFGTVENRIPTLNKGVELCL